MSRKRSKSDEAEWERPVPDKRTQKNRIVMLEAGYQHLRRRVCDAEARLNALTAPPDQAAPVEELQQPPASASWWSITPSLLLVVTGVALLYVNATT